VNGVSVVICTYNGSRVIVPTLEALSRQKFSGSAEIVLVDNNSDDGVGDIASRFWSGLQAPPFPLNSIRESRPGLAFARKAGVVAAKYDVIVFCDDDNLLGVDYLALASEALADPTVGAVGGAGTPVSDREFPPFFYTYAFHYAVGSPDLDAGPVDDKRGWLYGAGLTARRADLLAIYKSPAFPTLTGRVGSLPTASGDDLELCFSLRLLGRKLVYDDRLSFRHYIEPRKLEKDYVRRLRDGNRSEREIVTLYTALIDLGANRGLGGLLRKIARLGSAALRGKRDRFAEFWLLAFVGATPLMSPNQKRIFKHFKVLVGSKSSLRRPTT
jgi:glycosyltransferase involved in cell wall biosynthesis